MDKLSIVLALRNEEGSIEELIRRFSKVCKYLDIDYNIIVYSAGSTDNTGNIVKRLEKDIPVILYDGPKEQYFINALRHGLAKVEKDAYTLVSDADLQYLPEDLVLLWKYRKDYDLITGVRYRRKDPFYKKLISTIFHSLVYLVFMRPFRDMDTGFKLFNNKVLKIVYDNIWWLKNGAYTEIFLRVWKKGYRIKYVSIHHDYRRYGHTKITDMNNFFHNISMQLHGLFHLWKDLTF